MMSLLIDQDVQFLESPRGDLVLEEQQRRHDRMIRNFVSAINNQPAELIGKKPWEMIRYVWESTIAPVNKAYKTSISIGEEAAKAYRNRYGYTHNGYCFHATSISNSRHEVQVAYAYLRGDFVPDDVGNEYPMESWEQTYDLSEFRHLPRYVITADECLEAIECWEKRKALAEMAIKDKYFHYQSEEELKHYIKCYDRLLLELVI